MTIALGDGRVFAIEAPETSETSMCVRSAKLDGEEELDRAWLTHEELARGGRLVLEMGDAPSSWGQSERPPSVSEAE